MKKSSNKKEECNYTSIRYPAAIFLLWVFSPIILFAIVTFFGDAIFNERFVINLLLPGVCLSIISYFITKIKSKPLRSGSFYSLVGGLIWASPAIYFLPTSNIYTILTPQLRFLALVLPAAILSILFFYIGKNKEEPSDNLDDLYLKHAIYNK